MDALSDPAKTFDTSGKSEALYHHNAICKTPIALPNNGRFGAIAGKTSFQKLKLHWLATAKGSPARCRTARASDAYPRRYRREHSCRPQQGNGNSRSRSNQGCRSPAGKTLVTRILHRPSRFGARRTAHGRRIGGRRSRCDAWHPPTIGEGQREERET